MAFTPQKLGLDGITDEFGKYRPNVDCYHSGVDFSSSMTPKPIFAGIWGRVISPLGGSCSTVTIRPMHTPAYYVQYLHLSARNVSIGQNVTPCTVIGLTGDVGCGAVGIHLHLHVVNTGGAPQYECWSRNFVNPTQWDTGNPVAGNWFYSSNYVNNGVSVQDRRTFVFLRDSIGSPFSVSASETLSLGQDFVRNDYVYEGQVTLCDSRGIHVEAKLTHCTVTGTVTPPCNRPVRIADAHFIMNSPFSGRFELADGSGITISRTAAFSFEDHPINIDGDADVVAMSKGDIFGNEFSNEAIRVLTMSTISHSGAEDLEPDATL
ncbi:MAG: M23 family metallopeptidase [Rhodobacteraceae bacterium]|nr:M23 family metallopeptidase [Paracoccaceae bacterium]